MTRIKIILVSKSTQMNDSLHSLIRTDYGKDCLKITKDLERTARKVANYRNHLRFTLRCLQERVTPRSLKLSTNVKGFRADKIISSAERKLVNERVRQINFTISKLNNKKSEISRDLCTRLPPDVYDRVSQFTEHAQLSQHLTSKTRQIEPLHSQLTISSGKLRLQFVQVPQKWLVKEKYDIHILSKYLQLNVWYNYRIRNI